MRLLIDLQACQSPGGRIRGVGRYCLALARAMAQGARQHEVWFLLNGSMVASAAYLRDALGDLVPPERVVCWQSVHPTASIDPANHVRASIAERLREQFIEGFEADVVLTMSMVDGYGDSVTTSVRPGSSKLQVAIVFDLIPLVLPETYLPNPNLSAWYMRKVEHLKRCDLLLGISQFTTDEAMALLNLESGAVVNVSAAVGEEFHPLPKADAQAVGRKYGIRRPFVMYAGGYDSRKNLVRLIGAYAALPVSLRQSHQLVFVGGIGEPERRLLQDTAIAHDLLPEELIFTGYVSDEDLVRFYSASALYAFPSTHEGFGLPALEAMSCGAVVVGSDTTSLPEVIAFDDAMFDPYDVASISRKLEQGLVDESFRERMREHGLAQAKRFSWERSAGLAWEAIERRLADGVQRTDDVPVPRPTAAGRIAVLSTGVMPQALSLLGLSVTGVDVFGELGDPAFAGADFPATWKRRSIHSFVASMFDDVYVCVNDAPAAASLLIAAKESHAVLICEGDTCPAIATELLSRDSGLLARMLYGWGGYAALALRFDVESFTRLPMDMLAYGASRWRSLARFTTGPGSQSCLDELVAMPGVADLGAGDLSQLAMAAAENAAPRFHQRVLYVDISQLVLTDAGTGIQRVVRHIVAELLSTVPDGFRVEPVYLHAGDAFRYARSYTSNRFHEGVTLPGDSPVDFRQGDIFLGLDLTAHLVPTHKGIFQRLRSLGVTVNFVVYDMLPLQRPDCFDPPGLPTFRAWYETIAEVADGVLAISRTVAEEFKHWLPQAMPERETSLRLGWFHLGADLAKGVDATPDLTSLPPGATDRPIILMVGTVEPRKGHAQALAAFEQLWQQGVEVNLVLVGKPGWHVEKLMNTLRSHPQRGKRLFWLDKADDRQLVATYHAASALLAASEGEGFGLPLIEAAQYGLPIIARDLPVFREVAGEHAFFFSGFDAGALAGAVEQWLGLLDAGQAPESRGMPWVTWEQSAAQVVDVIVGNGWQDSWQPDGVRRFLATDYRAESTTGRLRRVERYTTGAPGLLYGTDGFEIKAGRYTIEVIGELAEGQGAAWVDVVAEDGKWRIASAALIPANGRIGLLHLAIGEDMRDMRLRIMVDTNVQMTFSTMEISLSE